ncbi:MBL fold metallo-hydrolase [Mesobacterium pallidum]|uniref:MBL fold metallo-hydrolase n=1 Tax=Mesobacterium pallidum TaxID=2872037 RepID=UPI001EE24AF6|nr:MBL fold metallo-hydrolase [Mesobacterium pallidum]
MSSRPEFITLGTAGGPMQNPDRAQPAHVVMHGTRPILVDCGEGAMGQLKRAGIEFRDVREIFLTHHHFDHIGSLFACLGLNMMTQRRDALAIYGPPGTAAILNGLFAACDVPAEIGFGVPGQRLPHPRDFVEVHEITPGYVVEIEGLRITCCENTHYRAEAEIGQPGYLSLSLRFDALGRSIVFTGDTGPCAGLEAFAKGADLLVGEMMDVDLTMSRVRAANPAMPEARVEMIRTHLAGHHLSPEQLGALAQTAGASRVVAVHFAPGFITPDTAGGYAARVASTFDGEVHLASDLAVY